MFSLAMEKAFLQKKNVNDSAKATTKFLMIEKVKLIHGKIYILYLFYMKQETACTVSQRFFNELGLSINVFYLIKVRPSKYV